ncbi:MAG: histidine kinase [Leptospiraceae bacterium]|nr:histidine kinase [Leptospiraceae bacterium]MCP5510718.1 histidine kinase [Leptospiraceae bacterium]
MTAKNDEAIDQKIATAIAQKEKLSVKSSKMNSRLEHYVLVIIKGILAKHGQERYTDMMYTILKELAINAVKANQKRIFFEEHNLDLADEAQYSEGLAMFKASFSDSMAEEYGKKSQQKGVYCQIDFHYNDNGMYVEVVNNTPVIKTEELRLREKMKKSMGYNDIAEFYMDNMDNSEGAGLGIALIIILMKNDNIDPNLFRIVTKPDRTIARVEIPFNSNYITFRDRGKQAKDGN